MNEFVFVTVLSCKLTALTLVNSHFPEIRMKYSKTGSAAKLLAIFLLHHSLWKNVNIFFMARPVFTCSQEVWMCAHTSGLIPHTTPPTPGKKHFILNVCLSALLCLNNKKHTQNFELQKCIQRNTLVCKVWKTRQGRKNVFQPFPKTLTQLLRQSFLTPLKHKCIGPFSIFVCVCVCVRAYRRLFTPMQCREETCWTVQSCS